MKFSYQNSQVETTELETAAQELSGYFAELKAKLNPHEYNDHEDVVLTPNDPAIIREAKRIAELTSLRECKLIVLVGIGGSNLGTWSLTAALGTEKEIVYVESISGSEIKAALDSMRFAYGRGDKACVIAISKSGNTTETVANLGIILAELQRLDQQWNQRTLVITDRDSKLWQLGQSMHLHQASIQTVIGGRYSIFTNAGLIPLTLADIDIDQFLAGAAALVTSFVNPDWQHNDALHSALIIYAHYKQRKRIHNSFLFEPSLRMWGQWYRQLAAESLGKHSHGFTPIISIGSTDLHSQLQLYLGGPDDKFTSFISVQKPMFDFTVPTGKMSKLAEHLEGKNVSTIMNAILTATQSAYLKDEQAFVEIELEELNAYHMGELMMFKVMETIYLAKLLGVDPFDQPEVEGYKLETKRILAQT